MAFEQAASLLSSLSWGLSSLGLVKGGLNLSRPGPQVPLNIDPFRNGLFSLPVEIIGDILLTLLSFELPLVCKYLYTILQSPGVRVAFAATVLTRLEALDIRYDEGYLIFRRRAQRWLLQRD